MFCSVLVFLQVNCWQKNCCNKGSAKCWMWSTKPSPGTILRTMVSLVSGLAVQSELFLIFGTQEFFGELWEKAMHNVNQRFGHKGQVLRYRRTPREVDNKSELGKSERGGGHLHLHKFRNVCYGAKLWCFVHSGVPFFRGKDSIQARSVREVLLLGSDSFHTEVYGYNRHRIWRCRVQSVSLVSCSSLGNRRYLWFLFTARKWKTQQNFAHECYLDIDITLWPDKKQPVCFVFCTSGELTSYWTRTKWQDYFQKTAGKGSAQLRTTVLHQPRDWKALRALRSVQPRSVNMKTENSRLNVSCGAAQGKTQNCEDNKSEKETPTTENVDFSHAVLMDSIAVFAGLWCKWCHLLESKFRQISPLPPRPNHHQCNLQENRQGIFYLCLTISQSVLCFGTLCVFCFSLHTERVCPFRKQPRLWERFWELAKSRPITWHLSRHPCPFMRWGLLRCSATFVSSINSKVNWNFFLVTFLFAFLPDF